MEKGVKTLATTARAARKQSAHEMLDSGISMATESDVEDDDEVYDSAEETARPRQHSSGPSIESMLGPGEQYSFPQRGTPSGGSPERYPSPTPTPARAPGVTHEVHYINGMPRFIRI